MCYSIFVYNIQTHKQMFSILNFKEVKNMKVVVVASKKGGPGKSTVATNLAEELSHFAPTMLIDGNMQGDASKCFKYQKNDEGETVDISSPDNCFENIFFKKSVTPLNVKPNLDLLIATENLRHVTEVIAKQKNNSTIFKRWLKKQKLSDYYGYIVIDTHNSDDDLLDNFFLAADIILAITTPGRDEMDGALGVYQKAEELRNDDNLLDDNDEPYMTASIAFVGNLLKGSKNTQTKEYLEKTKDNPLFIANFWERNIFRDAASENTTIFEIANRSKYSGESFKKFFKKTQEAFLAIKEAIDAA